MACCSGVIGKPNKAARKLVHAFQDALSLKADANTFVSFIAWRMFKGPPPLGGAGLAYCLRHFLHVLSMAVILFGVGEWVRRDVPWSTLKSKALVYAAKCVGAALVAIKRLGSRLPFVLGSPPVLHKLLSLIHISEPTRRTPISYAVIS